VRGGAEPSGWHLPVVRGSRDPLAASRGLSCGKRHRREGGACGVVRVKKGVRGKAGGDGGMVGGQRRGGPRGEGATRRREDVGPRPDRRVAPERPWPGSGARGRCGAVRTGERRPLTCGPWPAAGVRGSGEAWGRVGRPGKK
jgi:hypothetical protein